MAVVWPGRSARAVARQFMGLGARWGWSPDRFLRYLRIEKGIVYQRRLMFQDLKDIWGLQAVAGKARYLPRDVMPSSRIMHERPMLQPYKYQYVFEFKVRNRRTGEIRSVYRAMWSNERATRGELEDEFSDLYGGPEEIVGYLGAEEWEEVTSWGLHTVIHHEGWAY